MGRVKDELIGRIEAGEACRECGQQLMWETEDGQCDRCANGQFLDREVDKFFESERDYRKVQLDDGFEVIDAVVAEIEGKQRDEIDIAEALERLRSTTQRLRYLAKDL